MCMCVFSLPPPPPNSSTVITVEGINTKGLGMRLTLVIILLLDDYPTAMPLAFVYWYKGYFFAVLDFPYIHAGGEDGR